VATGPAVLRLGDRVRFDGAEHTVAGLAGTSVRLVSGGGQPSVVLLCHLLSAPGFELLDAATRPQLAGLGLLAGVPHSVVTAAREWERHVVEVDTGLPPDAARGARPRPEYDPALRTVRQREDSKAAELTAAGRPVSAMTVRRMRQRYRGQGLWGLVDQRSVRTANPLGGPTRGWSPRSPPRSTRKQTCRPARRAGCAAASSGRWPPSTAPGWFRRRRRPRSTGWSTCWPPAGTPSARRPPAGARQTGRRPRSP
jgi:hypothetical protein